APGVPGRLTLGHVEGIWPFVVVALIGVGVGVLVRGFFPVRARRATVVTPSSDGVSKDARELLRALRSTVLVLDVNGDVLQASPSAYSYGLVRSGRVVLPAVSELVGR